MRLVSLSIIIGSLALLMGSMLLFAPGLLNKINELMKTMVTRIDSAAFRYRVGIGGSLIVIAVFMFFMAYYFSKRYNL